MKKLNVKHYLGIYRLRKKMQDLGVTNPSKEIKTYTSALVEKLSQLPLDKEIEFVNHSLVDSKGGLILEASQEIKSKLMLYSKMKYKKK